MRDIGEGCTRFVGLTSKNPCRNRSFGSPTILKLNYAGSVLISTVDWTGRSVTTIFFRGCPLNCIYCQNHPYLAGTECVELELVKSKIMDAKPFISAVVFSGGEPLMQEAIVPLAQFVKSQNLKVGIHTNGCYPGMASHLVAKDLVDKFFIDIKAPFQNPELYGVVTGCSEKRARAVIPDIIDTIKCAQSCELELRTTLIRGLMDKQEIADIACWIMDYTTCRPTYVLQQGIPEQCRDEKLRLLKPLERDEMYEFGLVARCFLRNVHIRTREAGEEKI